MIMQIANLDDFISALENEMNSIHIDVSQCDGGSSDDESDGDESLNLDVDISSPYYEDSALDDDLLSNIFGLSKYSTLTSNSKFPRSTSTDSTAKANGNISTAYPSKGSTPKHSHPFPTFDGVEDPETSWGIAFLNDDDSLMSKNSNKGKDRIRPLVPIGEQQGAPMVNTETTGMARVDSHEKVMETKTKRKKRKSRGEGVDKNRIKTITISATHMVELRPTHPQEVKAPPPSSYHAVPVLTSSMRPHPRHTLRCVYTKPDFLTINFSYQSDLDHNGVLFWLGTHGYTKKYSNPQALGHIMVEMADLFKGDPKVE